MSNPSRKKSKDSGENMAVLSDKHIKERINNGTLTIKNYNEDNISVASVDLRLGEEFRVFKHTEVTHIDPNDSIQEDIMEYVKKENGKPFIIHPGELILGSTMEYIKMPPDLVARLDGRSSMARLGIIIHSTAGSVDPGFEGQLTLEIANISKVPVCLYPGTRICRITFDELSSKSERPYNERKNSKYVGQKGPQMSRIN